MPLLDYAVTEEKARTMLCWKKIGCPKDDVEGNWNCVASDCMAWAPDPTMHRDAEDNPTMTMYGQCRALPK
jgi:hypothetical protein